MKQRNKIAVGFTSIVLAGTLGLGAVASAAGPGEGDGGRRRRVPQLTVAERCEKRDEIEARAADRQTRISERIAALQAKRLEAETAGDTEKVEHIDHRLARLERVSTRIGERMARFATWVAENCDAD